MKSRIKCALALDQLPKKDKSLSADKKKELCCNILEKCFKNDVKISEQCKTSVCKVLSAYLEGKDPAKLDDGCPKEIRDIICILEELFRFRNKLRESPDRFEAGKVILEFLSLLGDSNGCFEQFLSLDDNYRRTIKALLMALGFFATIDDLCINNEEDAGRLLLALAQRMNAMKPGMGNPVANAAGNRFVRVAIVAMAKAIMRRGGRIKKCGPRKMRPPGGGQRPRPRPPSKPKPKKKPKKRDACRFMRRHGKIKLSYKTVKTVDRAYAVAQHWIDRERRCKPGEIQPTSEEVVTYGVALFKDRKKIKAGSETDKWSRMWARCTVGINKPTPDDAGHVIGHQLGGSGKAPGRVERGKQFNLFPQNARVNQDEMKVREDNVVDAAEENDRVCIKVTLRYSGANYDPQRAGRPGSLRYDVWVNYVKNKSAFVDPYFANRPG